jgi:hypothetical protein
MLTTLITIGVDFIVILLTEIALPLLFAAIDGLMCLLDYFKPSGWNDQLECVEHTCFKGPDTAADLLAFFSLPIIIGRFTAVMDATLNSRTGKRFFKAPKAGAVSSKGRTRDPISGRPVDINEPESATMGNPAYEFDFAGQWDDLTSTTAADECAACFVCKVPEMRILWWFVASITSLVSPSNFAQYAGNVTDNCQTNGSWYLDACGPYGTERLPYSAWKRGGYTAGVAQIDTNIFDAYAASVIDLNERLGAGRDPFFAQYVQAAHQWQSVDPENMEERALAFIYHSCRNMRHEAEESGLTYDQPEKYQDLDASSVARTSTQFMYDTCRRFKYEIFTPGGRFLHNTAYQFKACGEDKVWCKKDKIKCLNRCGGSDGAEYKHDFATIVSSTELSRFVLGDGFDAQAAADCTVRSYTFKVPVFRGGDSFATFAARMRVRSGMTAIDTQFCNDNAASCGVIQNVLEKAPGLVFVNGAFRHKYSLVPPSPPPSPHAPPRLFQYAPDPPRPPPPPGTPPPYYADAEPCLPLPRLADYGLDITTDAIDGAQTEERASCLYAKRVLDEKRRASACFAHIAYPHPPPPPVTIAHDTAAAADLRRQRERLGDLEAYEAPRKTDRAQWEEDTATALLQTDALIDALGENNPILRDLLGTAKQEIYAASVSEGRRLMQRREYNVRMTDELVTAEIMEFYGSGGIPGVTQASCEALCEATAQLDAAHPDAICRAFAFKRAAPFSYVDKSGWCYLLKSAGACKIEDFGVELYTRLRHTQTASAHLYTALKTPLCVCLLLAACGMWHALFLQAN